MFKNDELNALYVGSNIINAKDPEKVKRVAYLLLLETDYSALSDVALDNADEFTSYRKKIREVLKASVPTYQFPLPPEPQWTQDEGIILTEE